MLWTQRCVVDNGVCVCVCVCVHGRYFLVDSDGNVLVQQEGIFRSNCMDCLDRTNVIQSLLARRSLQSQLQVSDGPTGLLDMHTLCRISTVNTLD